MKFPVDAFRLPVGKMIARAEALLFPARRTPAYVTATVLSLVAIGFIVRQLIGPAELGIPFLTFFPAAAISAVFGGFWAGMAATVLGATLATYFYIPPYSMFSFAFRSETVFGNMVYFADELIVCSAIAALYRFNRKTKDQNLELNTLIQTIPDLIWLKSPQGAYLECNPAIERFFGIPRSEIIGRTDRELFPASQWEAVHDQDRASLASNGTLTREAWVMRGSDRSAVLLETTTTTMRAADGTLIGVLGIARDITVRRGLEDEVRARTAELERERALLSAIFEHTGDGILAVDGEGSIVLANQQARRMLAMGGREYSPRLGDLWPEWPELAKAASDRRELRRELESGGRLFALSVTPTGSAGETRYVIVARDVSEEHRLADERRELDRQMFQMEKMATLGELAMGVAHEIGNPLAGMKAVAQSLQYEENLEEDVREALRRLESEIDRLGTFLRSFHGFAAPQRPNPVACRLKDIVEDVLFWTRKEAVSHNVAVGLAVDEALLVRADPNPIKQVLLNLFVNAIHAMPDGGTLRITAHRSGADRVRIDVIDNGGGIDASVKTRIFDPFFTTRSSGSGLGLAVVKKIVGEHGASIDVRSEVGHGSCFTLLWPAA